ncbi:MAG: hypothetical protein KME09_06960 [Pleurocapsa minor HA4230-MV1]|jgi:hypothetical protein|nr:hypothetical protein [Pleurocapsa minor HA4230-MV1]
MKNIKLSLIGFIIPISWLLSSAIVNAQTKVTIEPEDLTIAGSRFSQVETRQIFITPNESIQNLQINVSARSLYRTDGLTVFPITAIQPQPNQKQPNEIIVPIEFNLQQAPSSGEFQGKFNLSYQPEGEDLPVTVGIPVTVKVKDNWFLPLAILLIGTGLGIAVSAYRAQGQPRDEVLVRVGRIRTEMQEDIELIKAPSFVTTIEAHLYDVKAGLQGDKLETARVGIDKAEHIWAKWIKGRTDWLNQFAYWEKLNQQLEDLNPNIPYVQIVRRDTEDASREASNLEGPHKLRDRLDELAGHINRFLQLQALDKQLKDLLGQLPSEEKSNWESKIRGWERQINQIQPSELAQDATLVEEMEGAIAEISQLVAQQSGTSVMAKGILSIPHLAPAPSARPLSWERQVSGARWRLWWFKKVSYAIALLFLTGAGFNQLYVGNPTFGANPWKDYFALLAWGFGAEATRDAITKTVQGWGLPGLK